MEAHNIALKSPNILSPNQRMLRQIEKKNYNPKIPNKVKNHHIIACPARHSISGYC